MQNHLWCPNDPRGKGIDDDDNDTSAVARPLLKKPSLDPNCTIDLFPICLFPKSPRKIVLSQLLTHMGKNSFLNPHQSAYRSGRRTGNTLLRMVGDLRLGFDDEKVSILTLLDLSAAVDTTDHTVLPPRLQHCFDICDLALAWFRSYLTNRKQTVCVNGIYSDFLL